jgi:hypothetical protein
MRLGTTITYSHSVASRGRPLRKNTLTAQQKRTVVAGYGLIGVAGGPRARGDLGYPPAARMLSGGSLLAWQDGAETREMFLERTDASCSVLPCLPEGRLRFWHPPELGASAV